MELFSELKKEFFSREKNNKWDFAVNAMEKCHKILWDYARSIQETDIKSLTLKDGKVIAEISGGIKLYCREMDTRSMPMDILNFNEYEKEHMDYIQKVMERLEHRNILDIGANIGYTSCLWAKKFSDAKIWAYEPIKSTYTILCDNIRLNQFEQQINAYNVGISDKNMETDFYFYPWCSANTSIHNLQHRGDAVIEHAVLNRLDDRNELEDISIDFIKCDVEGNELYVIKGADKLIEKNLPVISIEILRKYSREFGYEANDVVKGIRKYGYVLYCIRNGKLLRLDGITEELDEANFLFLHERKHEKMVEEITT